MPPRPNSERSLSWIAEDVRWMEEEVTEDISVKRHGRCMHGRKHTIYRMKYAGTHGNDI
jgi:hypothetical protein